MFRFKNILSIAICILLNFGFSINDHYPEKKEFEISYNVKVNDIPDKANSMRVFVPIPESDKYQTISDLNIKTKYEYVIKEDTDYGNKYASLKLKGNIPEKFGLKVQCKVVRKKVRGGTQYKATPKEQEKFLSAAKLIPLDSTMEREANKAIGSVDESKTKAKVRAFYNYLLDNMEYDKSGKGWGKGNALFACNAKRGNCTDFHSLFIGMSRSQQIPARFHIGFPLDCSTKGDTITGYHCWTEYRNEENAWVPLDISEAWKHPDKKEFYYGNLDPCRVRFSTGRDIPIKINDNKTKELNYFVYPHVMVNGEEYEDVSFELVYE